MGRILNSTIHLVPWRVRSIIKHLPVIAPFQRWLLASFSPNKPFLHKINAGPAAGLRCWVTLPQDKGLWTGTYEAPLADRVSQAVRPGDCCLDVGGWRGFFAGVMALAGASRVTVFEPLPQNLLEIRRMIELNPTLPIEIVESAIADYVGVTTFQVLSETSMAKLDESSFQSDVKGDNRIDVHVETLDNLHALGRFERVDVIKLDVEGAEAMALRGAKNLLAQYRPRIFIEVHSRLLARECADLLAGVSYSVEVLETGRAPDFISEPEVCHFVATATT